MSTGRFVGYRNLFYCRILIDKMRAFIVLSCLAFAAARPEAGYSYQRPGGSGGISSGFSGSSGSSFGIGHGGGSFGGSFSSGGSSSLSGFGAGGVCSKIYQKKKISKIKNQPLNKSNFITSFPYGKLNREQLSSGQYPSLRSDRWIQ